MPFKTIQQSFTNGEINPKGSARSDTEMYYKSAAKLRDVSVIPYGGIKRRSGLEYVGELAQTTQRLTAWTLGTGLTDGGSTLANANDNDKDSYFYSTNTIGATLTPLIRQYSTSAQNIKKVTVKNVGLKTVTATGTVSVIPAVIAITDFQYSDSPDPNTVRIGTAVNIPNSMYHNRTIVYYKAGQPYAYQSVYIFWAGSFPYTNSLYYEKTSYDNDGYTPYAVVDPSGVPTLTVSITNGGLGYKTAPAVTVSGDGIGAVATATISAGVVNGVTITGGSGYSTASISIAAPETDHELECQVIGYDVNGQPTQIGENFTLTTTKQSFFADIDADYKDVRISAISGQDVCLAGFEIGEFNLHIPNTTKSVENVKLLPFIFNNDQNYVLGLTNQQIKIFQNDTLQGTLTSTAITDDIVKNIRWAQEADTGILTHADLATKKLLRGKPYDVYMTLVNCSVDEDDTDIIEFALDETLGWGALQPSCIRFSEAFKPAAASWSITQKIHTEANDKDISQLFIYTPPIGAYYSGLILGRESYQSDTDAGKLYLMVGTQGKLQQKVTGSVIPANTDIWIRTKFTAGVGYTVETSEDGDEYTYATDITLAETGAIFPYSQGPLEMRVNGGTLDKSELSVKISTATWYPQSTLGWVLSDYPFDSVPWYDYEQEDYEAPAVAITPDADEGTIKFTFTSGALASYDLVGQYLEGNGGKLKITEQADTYIIGYSVIPFYTKDAIAGGDWSVSQSFEPVWSAARGWPACATFHAGRLWLGGSKYRPQSCWGSKVGLYTKFDPTSGYANDAIDFTLDTNTLNKITDLYSKKNLIIFTGGGEFAVITAYNEAITPDNINATLQSANGSWDRVGPIDINNAILFLERKGQALANLVFDGYNSYNSSNESVLNSHLLDGPVDMAIERNNMAEQSHYVYIVNNDGTLCVICLLQEQNITGGFTLWKTTGTIKAVCVLPNASYVAVERSFMDYNAVVLEKINEEANSDCCKIFDVAATTSSFIFTQLAKQTVDIWVDGEYIEQKEIDENGALTLTTAAAAGQSVELGLPFRYEVESNIMEIPDMGTGVGKRKRIAASTIRVLDTKNITFNGETQTGAGVGEEDLKFFGIGDWSEKPKWTITETIPCRATILAVQSNVNYEVQEQ